MSTTSCIDDHGPKSDIEAACKSHRRNNPRVINKRVYSVVEVRVFPSMCIQKARSGNIKAQFCSTYKERRLQAQAESEIKASS